jgi:hypothetical protein
MKILLGVKLVSPTKYRKKSIPCEISGSHSRKYKDDSLLGYYTEQYPHKAVIFELIPSASWAVMCHTKATPAWHKEYKNVYMQIEQQLSMIQKQILQNSGNICKAWMIRKADENILSELEMKFIRESGSYHNIMNKIKIF